MKKIVSVFLAVFLCTSICFALSASAAETPLSVFDLQRYATGLLSDEFVHKQPSSGAYLQLMENTDGTDRWVRFFDNNSTDQLGFKYPISIADGAKTVCMDIKNYYDVSGFVRLYSGDKMYASLSINPENYVGATLEDYEWTNIAVVIKPTTHTIDLYKNGKLSAKDTFDGSGLELEDELLFTIYTQVGVRTQFDIKNFKVYDGEYVLTEAEITAAADRELVDYVESYSLLNNTLESAVAMTVGNSMARVNNKYVNIDSDNKYVAPFVTEDGHTLIPARFTTETIGCTVEEITSGTSYKIYNDDTVMEITVGETTATINEESVDMPTAPIIKYDRLYIPLRFAAETFGKEVFWDDRGLIVISDETVLESGNEDVIKPLITEIRNRSTIFGNAKYSDVNYSSRYFQTFVEEWNGIDAAKRFMATVNRWTYVLDGRDAQRLRDLGTLQQATLNGNVTGEYVTDGSEQDPRAYSLSGDLWVRDDGLGNWGCVNNPYFLENIKARAKQGLDNGYYVWQFDDWPLNFAYGSGGCMCDYCIEGFTYYLNNDATEEDRADFMTACEINDITTFDMKEWLENQGITEDNYQSNMGSTTFERTRKNWLRKCLNDFHTKVIAYMEEYSGSDVFYSINAYDTLSAFSESSGGDQSYMYNMVEGTMGETNGVNMTAENIYILKQLLDSMELTNVISPLPKDFTSTQNMYSGIAMCYATGQQMLVPWDVHITLSNRYYATVEELAGMYEMVREYPFLFDNYEMPAQLGYVIDLNDETGWSTNEAILVNCLNNGIAAKSLVVEKNNNVPTTFTENHIKGLQAIIGPADKAGLSEDEITKITNSGATYVSKDDTDVVAELESTYWTVRDDKDVVHTILRQNQLYDNAPTVVHAVSYNEGVSVSDVEIEMNNLYLPAGDTLTINVYKNANDYVSYTVNKGTDTTTFTIDSLERWAILEICGPNTVRREVSFDIGVGYNGIGLGSRVSKDKAYGTTENFTIVTYSEGINSTTYGDPGTQDEAAFVYKHIEDSKFKTSEYVKAGFSEFGGESGVMIREGLYSNARFVALKYDQNGLRLAVRTSVDAPVIYTELGDTRPEYMKIQKEDTSYIMYTSQDDVTYNKVGSVDIEFSSSVAGVFAASPDGSRAECNICDFEVNEGEYVQDKITLFELTFEDNEISIVDPGRAIDVAIETEKLKDIDVSDVDISYVSSNEDVLIVEESGKVVPKSTGTATVTATATLRGETATATIDIAVVLGDNIMFEEDFSTGVWPSYMTHSSNSASVISDGALLAMPKTENEDYNVFWTFDQYDMPTVFEFDFYLDFATSSEGVRLIYANNQAISLTASAPTIISSYYPYAYINWVDGETSSTRLATVKVGEWHTAKIEANYAEQWCNVYIDGEQVATKVAPRYAMSPDGEVHIGSTGTTFESCCKWDNFKFYYVESLD